MSRLRCLTWRLCPAERVRDNGRFQNSILKTLFQFFDGLIPEGWLLGVVSRNWKIDTKDRFGLLLVACKDGIGNVSIREERI